MYSSTFIFAPGSFDESFHRLDQEIAAFATSIPGYLGQETWENTATGLVSNVYYWETLTRRQIPFVKFGGLKFLEAAHVKDMLAILRFAQNPRGRMAGFRVLQLIPGIGPAHATRLLQAMDVAADPCAALDDFQVPANAAAPWQAFVQLYRALRHPGNVWPADMDLAKRWYGPHLERLHLLVPHRFYVTQQSAMGDRHLYAARSRFIPDALAAQFDTQVWPLAAAQIASSCGTGTATLQVRDRARAAWR